MRKVLQFKHLSKARQCLKLFSSTVTITGLDIVSPTIGLSDDQQNFYQLAKSFADKEMKPFADKWNEDGEFPLTTYHKLADLGFAGILVKEDVGGSNLSRLDATLIFEALSTGCVGTTAMLTIHNMCAAIIDKYGTEEQRKTYLHKLCSLQLKASYCLTEPGSGSDAASMLTVAKYDKSSDSYTINGTKAFISGAGMSDIYLVMSRTIDESNPSDESKISCFIVPKSSEGLSFGKNEKKMGWKVQPTKQVILDNVKIPSKNLLGEVGQGFRIAMVGLDGGRLNIGACSLGAAQECFEKALAYTKERKQFSKSISSNQAIQFQLSDMAGKLITSRLLLRNSANLLDSKSNVATSHCALAKQIVTDNCFEICNDALQLHGGYGYLQDYQIERFVRDVRVHQILEGTNQIMRHIVGRSLVK